MSAISPAALAARLRGEREILAVAHESPDGDALGCIAALSLMCERLGVPCRTYIPGAAEFPPEYSFLPRLDAALRGAAPMLAPGTVVYLMDCASLVRSNSLGFGDDVITVNIDHHQDNPGFGSFNLLDPTAASTTALLYEVCVQGDLALDKEIATALYVGLLTDTGRFQYSNTTPAAHRMAARLLEEGVEVTAIYRKVYEDVPLAKLLLQQRALSRLEVRLGGALVTAWLNTGDFTSVGADDGYSEGLIDTLRGIKGAKVAALVREREREGGLECRVSLRSTDGDVNVARLAAIKGGGGHVRAAGFTSAGGVTETLDWLEREIRPLL